MKEGVNARPQAKPGCHGGGDGVRVVEGGSRLQAKPGFRGGGGVGRVVEGGLRPQAELKRWRVDWRTRLQSKPGCRGVGAAVGGVLWRGDQGVRLGLTFTLPNLLRL